MNLSEINSRPFISVVINCFNGARYLRETIDSLLAQTYRDFEVVFWDNQSTDNSAQIIKSFPDVRIRYFYAPRHTTLGEARNLAIAEARGTWVAFLDCDDIWSYDKLAAQCAIIEEGESDLGMVYTRTQMLGGKLDGNELVAAFKDKPLPEGKILRRYLSIENFIPLPSALILKSAFFEAGQIPVHLKQSEDYYLFASIAARYRVRCVQHTATYYRIHDSNLTRKQRYDGVIEAFEVINHFETATSWDVISLLKKEYLKGQLTFLGLLYSYLEKKPLSSLIHHLNPWCCALSLIAATVLLINRIETNHFARFKNLLKLRVQKMSHRS